MYVAFVLHQHDDDNHGHAFVPPGPGNFCDFDVFAGGLWSQRVKQFLLSNGIAVMEASGYTQDGWEAWQTEWSGGYDPAFFAALGKAMAPKQSAGGSGEGGGPLAMLDHNNVAFRGWSGSAQMVSWLINEHAEGRLGEINVKAGVLMSGGSHACYSTPGRGEYDT